MTMIPKQPSSPAHLTGEFAYNLMTADTPKEFWFEATGFDERCYVLATDIQPTEVPPSGAEQWLATRPPASDFKVYWPIVKFFNLTTGEFALLHYLSQHQNLMCAHAALSYWLTPSYIVFADLDEYLMTSKPTTIPEVMRSNMYAGDNLLSVLNIQAVNGKRFFS
ncbi:MAG: hypothetical protein WDW36_004925 [Sanguina aurantia]